MTGRVVIACPNLSLDHTIEVPGARIGTVHRSTRSDIRGGGKGVNVARALAAMGMGSTVVGMVAGRIGQTVIGMLDDEGLAHSHIETGGETRSCLTVLAPEGITVFNGSGPQITSADWDSYRAEVAARLEGAAIFACCGSWPPGSPPNAAARLIEIARAAGCWTLLDTSRAQLGPGIDAGADVVKPNLAEARALSGEEAPETIDPSSLPEARRCALALASRARGGVVVSAGSAGAVVATEAGEVIELVAPSVTVVNPVGAGDCLAAGLIVGRMRGLSDPEVLRLAMAMAAGSCETFYAGALDPARVTELLSS